MFLPISLPFKTETEESTAIAQCRTKANLTSDFQFWESQISVLFSFWNKTSNQGFLFTSKSSEHWKTGENSIGSKKIITLTWKSTSSHQLVYKGQFLHTSFFFAQGYNQLYILGQYILFYLSLEIQQCKSHQEFINKEKICRSYIKTEAHVAWRDRQAVLCCIWSYSFYLVLFPIPHIWKQHENFCLSMLFQIPYMHTRIKSWFSNSLHLSHPQVLIPFIAPAALNCYPPSFILYSYHWPQFLPFSYLNPCPVSHPRIAALTCHAPFRRISVFLAIPIFYFMFLELQIVLIGSSYTQVQQKISCFHKLKLLR